MADENDNNSGKRGRGRPKGARDKQPRDRSNHPRVRMARAVSAAMEELANTRKTKLEGQVDAAVASVADHMETGRRVLDRLLAAIEAKIAAGDCSLSELTKTYQAIGDRVFGKPPQTMEISQDPDRPLIDYMRAHAEPDELERMADAMEASARANGTPTSH